MNFSSFIVHTWVHMGTHWWTWTTYRLKVLWVRCPMGINIGKNLHYLWSFQHQSWVNFLVIVLFYFFFTIKSCWILIFHVVFLLLFFLFHNLNLELGLPFVLVWGRKFYSLGCFHAHDSYVFFIFNSKCWFKCAVLYLPHLQRW
jgi:hypothetical protein